MFASHADSPGGLRDGNRGPYRWWLGLLIFLPWAVPFTAGPLPNAWPWLSTAVCAALLCAAAPRLDPKVIALAWSTAAVVNATAGLVQYFGFAEGLTLFVPETGPGDAFGMLRQRNQFATLTSIGLVAVTGWISLNAAARTLPYWTYVGIFLLAAGNAASGSRTGLLQWILVLGLTVLWNRSHRGRTTKLVLAGVLAYFAAVLLLPWILRALTGLSSAGLLGRLAEGSGCTSRKVLWSNVLSLIAEKPLTGWGWGELDFAHFMTLYPGPRFCEMLDNAHNLPLHLAVELGIPAAVLVCSGASWLIWRAKPWSETDPARQMAWGVLALILLHSMLEYPLWYGPFQMAAVLCVLIQWPASDAPMAKAGPSLKFTSIARIAVAASMLMALTYAAWDYHRVRQIYLPSQARDPAYREDTINKIRGSWLFRNQVQFAELTITPLTRGNAQWIFDSAEALLHFSPEPRVIEKVIDSAVMLGRDEEAFFYLARYRAAYPQEYEKWRDINANTSASMQRP